MSSTTTYRWAIIRLVQRAGRVDRNWSDGGRTFCAIHFYQRKAWNASSTCVDAFGHASSRTQKSSARTKLSLKMTVRRATKQLLTSIMSKQGLLDDERDNDVDLASHAYQIWKNAITQDPSLDKIVPALPAVVYSSQPHTPTDTEPEGALVYIRTGQENDALAWDRSRRTERNRIPVCKFFKPRRANQTPKHSHHLKNTITLCRRAARLIISEERTVGGQLGRPSGARFRTYERLYTARQRHRRHTIQHPRA